MSKSTRSKLIKSSTSLEYLPNEIFISIFSYLSGVDTVLAFSNLNSRFYSLSNQYCYFFDFKSISKTKLDFILTQQRNKQFWKSLQLSNNEDETPGQIEYFCQLYSLSNICPQLESLSLLNIEQIHNNEELLTQLLLSSSNLQSLTIEPICATVLSNINLSQLKRLVIHSCKNIGWMKVRSSLL
ncbi:hypothetical protein I4U23_003539 [Adineta vaga]|nr:hypothetical protein I4U23_003539 [Adineta vaga]